MALWHLVRPCQPPLLTVHVLFTSRGPPCCCMSTSAHWPSAHHAPRPRARPSDRRRHSLQCYTATTVPPTVPHMVKLCVQKRKGLATACPTSQKGSLEGNFIRD